MAVHSLVMDKLTGHITRKFAAMFNVGDVILYGKYKNKKGRILSFGKNDKGQPTIIIEPIPKGRKKNKEMGLYKIWTTPKAEVEKAKAEIKAEQEAAKEKKAAIEIQDPKLKQFAELFAKGLSDSRILQTMNITLNEAHAMANRLRDLLGITSMDSLRKTLKMRHADDMARAVFRRFYAQEGGVDLQAEKVVARHVKSFGIPMGKTWDSGDVRIHRYAESFLITDLTNAGKRGKKCKEMHVSTSYKYKGDKAGWMEQMSKALPDYDSFARVKGFFEDILKDYPGEIDIAESEKRGIDVNPGGTTEIRLKTNTGIEIQSEPLDFHVKTHVPLSTGSGYQDTLYWPRKKDSAKVFYNWLKANLAEANRMDIQGFMRLWDEIGVLWNSH